MASNKVDVALQIYDGVSNALAMSGLSEETSKKYAYFAVEMYKYIKDRPQLQTALQGAKSVYGLGAGAKGYAVAARLATNATEMNALSSAGKFVAKGNVSAGGAICAFVDYFSVVAKSLNVEMNECALSVTKVMLDVLGYRRIGGDSGGCLGCSIAGPGRRRRHEGNDSGLYDPFC